MVCGRRIRAEQVIDAVASVRSPMTRTKAQQRDWEDLAQLDPLWAISSAPEKRHGNWDEEAFYAGGARKASKLLRRLDALGVPASHGRALDFGCGAGRITLPLADRFDAVVGVDIAPSMLALARSRAGARKDVDFRLDESGDQSLFAGERFDLVYTGLVLQHLPTSADALACLGRLCAAVAPGGALIAQIPTRLPARTRLQLGQRAYKALRRLGVPASPLYRRTGLHPMRMTSVARDRVEACLDAAGLRVLTADERSAGGGVSLIVYAARAA
jgi:SAM-dependent methyltransferase